MLSFRSPSLQGAALTFMLALLAAFSPAGAQERLSASDLAGVELSEQSWNWSDDPNGTKTEAVSTAATVVDRSCGQTEFHAWQAADQGEADRIQQVISADFQNAGWEIGEPALNEGGQSIHLVEKDDRELVFEWLRIPDQQAVALFLCEAEPAVAADQAPPAQAEEAPPAQVDEAREDDSTGFILGIGLAFAAVGFGLLWNTMRHRSRATAAASWPVAEAKILSSKVMVETDTDSDNRTTTSFVPRLRYSYSIDSQLYEGSRISFGSPSFASRSKAQAVVDRYPEGSSVEVRYDPARPSDATLETEKPGIWKAVFGAIFLMLGVVIAAVGGLALTVS